MSTIRVAEISSELVRRKLVLNHALRTLAQAQDDVCQARAAWRVCELRNAARAVRAVTE